MRMIVGLFLSCAMSTLLQDTNMSYNEYRKSVVNYYHKVIYLTVLTLNFKCATYQQQ